MKSEFGCCPDDRTPAKGPNMEGCGCETSEFGCCPDGKTAAGGKLFEGCTIEKAPVSGGIKYYFFINY